MKYAVLMFDIVDSRKYKKRYEVQQILMNNIKYLNYLFKSEIKKEVVSSAGDEFQGLFLNLKTAYLYIRKLQMLIFPIKLRCGIGYGEIAYDVEKWSSVALDGEAYHLAREALDFLSNKKNNSILFNIDSKYVKYLNALCELDIELKNKQSKISYWIDLLSDVIMPIVSLSENIDFYNSLLANRKELIKSEEWNDLYGGMHEVDINKTNFQYLFAIKEKNLTKVNNDKFYVKDFWCHGMTTYIANSLNTSRQNIDRYISLGKIKESRKIEKIIYELLGENIW